jgi:threonyl-tRNA synthetase
MGIPAGAEVGVVRPGWPTSEAWDRAEPVGTVQYPGTSRPGEQFPAEQEGRHMAGVISVRLPDGSQRELAEGTTAGEFALSIGRGLAKSAVVATVDGHQVDLSTPLPDGADVAIITAESEVGRQVLRHSTSHVLAQAVLRLWPGAKYAIGPVIENGFYYDFELPGGTHFSDDDLERIDAEMRLIIKEDQPFVRDEHPMDEGLAIFGDQPFKQEIIQAVGSGDAEVESEVSGSVVSTYRNSDTFIDLCRGPHVPSTGRLGHFKLMRVAGAYWRGDEKRAQLQRIYGTAWESDKALAAHLHQLEEAERRDHRKLGAELDLFSFPEEIGPGLAVFHPKGGTIRRLMEDYSRTRHVEAGYEFVNSPHITKSNLFEISGHLDWFADGMYPPMELDGDTKYYLKPMNCPFHILVYKSRQRSYRELPLRLFEFGTVYRYEKSGVLQGLTRVRGMTQDDAHIFCTRDQMKTELIRTLHFVLDLLRDYGLNEFYLELSTKPPGKAVGSDEDWVEATETLRQTAEEIGLDLVTDEGGGAFYGPKISVQAKDAIGRTWQMSTVQLDFQLPQRFEMEYVGADNARHRPIMIHRALFGSVERFMAVLIEHYAGALPTWLSPEQVRVLPVTDAHHDYACSVVDACAAAGLRATVDTSGEKLGALVRRAKVAKLPYVLVVGNDDVAAGTVGVNRRGSTDNKPELGVPMADFVAEVVAEVDRKGLPEDKVAQSEAQVEGEVAAG